MPKGHYLQFSEAERRLFELSHHLPFEKVHFYLTQIFEREIHQDVLRRWLVRNGYKRSFATPNGRFQKGHKTWNKGMKGYCPSPETLWKKGHGCWWRAKEIGTERVNRYGHIEVKVTMTHAENEQPRRMWRYRSHLVWEQYTGESPPKGMIVLHLNSNPTDDRIENLALITQRENLALINHGFHKLPQDPQIRQAMLTLVKFDIKRREFDEKHGFYKKYINPKKAQSATATQAGAGESEKGCEGIR